MSETPKIKIVASDGEVVYEATTSALPKDEELKQLFKDKPNKKTSLRMTGPEKEGAEMVWVFKQRD